MLTRVTVEFSGEAYLILATLIRRALPTGSDPDFATYPQSQKDALVIHHDLTEVDGICSEPRCRASACWEAHRSVRANW